MMSSWRSCMLTLVGILTTWSTWLSIAFPGMIIVTAPLWCLGNTLRAKIYKDNTPFIKY